MEKGRFSYIPHASSNVIRQFLNHKSFKFNPLKGPLTLVLEGRNLYKRKAGIKGSNKTSASTYKNVLVVPITIVCINLLQAFANCKIDKCFF